MPRALGAVPCHDRGLALVGSRGRNAETDHPMRPMRRSYQFEREGCYRWMADFFVGGITTKNNSVMMAWRESLGEMMLNGIADDFGVIGEVHLVQQAGPVGADRLGANRQFFGNGLHGFTHGEQQHDLELPVG